MKSFDGKIITMEKSLVGYKTWVQANNSNNNHWFKYYIEGLCY